MDATVQDLPLPGISKNRDVATEEFRRYDLDFCNPRRSRIYRSKERDIELDPQEWRLH